MATITSVQSGLWSDSNTWDSDPALPVDDDTVVIADGHTVEFDVNLSGWAHGVNDLNPDGTLKFTRTPGTYYLKMKEDSRVEGTGSIDLGTEEDRIPFETKHTIIGLGSFRILGTGFEMTMAGTEPETLFVRTTGAESIGATELAVDTDVTGDIWEVGDTVYICNIDEGRDTEERTIDAITDGVITINEGLTSAKLEGTYIVLGSRNVNVIGGSGNYLYRGFTTGNWHCYGGKSESPYRIGLQTYEGTIQGLYIGYGFNTAHRNEVKNAIFPFSDLAFTNSRGLQIEDSYFIGKTRMVQSCSAFYASNTLIAGTTLPVYLSDGILVDCEFIGNDQNVREGVVSMKNCTSVNCDENFREGYFTAYNCDITKVVHATRLPRYFYSYSIDNNQIAGEFASWTRGGTTETVDVGEVPMPCGDYERVYETTFHNATHSVAFWEQELTVNPGQSVTLELCLRKNSSMNVLPSVSIFRKRDKDPLTGGASVFTFTMTNSVDTWENTNYTYSNDGENTEVLVIRSIGDNSSGENGGDKFWSAIDFNVINVDLTSALAKLDHIKDKTDTLKNASLLIDNEIIV